MKGSPDQLRQLGPLIMTGKLEELRERMVAIWPPDSYLDEEDVGLITMILLGVRNIHGEKGRIVYMPFSNKLKSRGERRWLRTLALRAEIVQVYEGLQEALVWLECLRKQTLPPNDGVVSLVIGKVHFSAGNYAEAREHFLWAVNQSLLGGGAWFRLEALNEMAFCLAKVGESRLAFEYARTLCIESFKLGRTIAGPKMDEYDLYQSIYALALIFGQVEYAIDIRRNLADRFRKQRAYTASSQFASDVGFRLAELGAKEEAVVHIKMATQDAEMGSHPGDPPFAAALHLLAKYIDDDPIRLNLTDILELSIRFAFPPMVEAIRETQELTRNSLKSAIAVAKIWQQVITAYNVAVKSGVRDGRVGKLLVGVHAAALVSRFFAEIGQNEAANLIEQAIATSSSRDAIFILTRERYIDKLVQHSDFKQALEICNMALHQKQFPLEQFSMRDFAARCNLALGDKQKAYSLARLALSDWHRVLEGLYTKQRKLYWLKRGVECLSCAIASIREPVSWMTEDDRRKALFDLVELQKARLASDMMTQNGHIPGTYDLSNAMSKGVAVGKLIFSSQYPEWTPVRLLQIPPLFSDFMTTVFHDDSGKQSILNIDLAVLRSMLQLPIDPDKQLLATASALRFEGYDNLYRDELYSDIIMVLSPGEVR